MREQLKDTNDKIYQRLRDMHTTRDKLQSLIERVENVKTPASVDPLQVLKYADTIKWSSAPLSTWNPSDASDPLNFSLGRHTLPYPQLPPVHLQRLMSTANAPPPVAQDVEMSVDDGAQKVSGSHVFFAHHTAVKDSDNNLLDF